MLIKYLRNSNRHPFGVIVALQDENNRIRMGWSACHPKDKFNKKLGIRIAVGRAIDQDYYNYMISSQLAMRGYEFMAMRSRAQRYFKDAAVGLQKPINIVNQPYEPDHVLYNKQS